MRLKILLLPFIIVLTLVLAMGFIQPDVAAMQVKKTEIASREAQVSNIENVIANIEAFSSSLDAQIGSETFVQNYVPKTMDQDKVIDALNFSALQSGVSIEGMELAQVKAPTEEIDPALVGVNPDGTPMTGITSRPKTFTVGISVKGGYENIKDFISRVTHMNRYLMVKNFSVEAPSDGSGVLVGKMYADFDYISAQKNVSALASPVFNESALNFASLQSTFDWVTNPVPALEKPATGKPNPFQ